MISQNKAAAAWQRPCSVSGGLRLFDRVIDPGKKQSGVVGYEIPEDWEKMKITFRPDIYEYEKATYLIEQNP